MNAFGRTISASWPPVVVYLVLTLCTFIGDKALGPPAYDQNLYHYHVVRQFEQEWPAVNIADYGAATGPGYHIVLATASKAVGYELDTLRLVSLVLGMGLIVAVAGWAATSVGPRAASLLTMPLAASTYVLGSGLHVHTDNFGWMFVVLALGPVVFQIVRPLSFFTAGLFALLAVSVRQIFIWTIGPIIFAGLLASPLVRTLPDSILPKRESAQRSWGLLTCAIAAAIPAVVLLFVFIGLWGGLVPPRFSGFHASGYSLCAFGYALAVAAIYAPFFLMVVPDIMGVLYRVRVWVIVFAIIGAVLSVLGPSDVNIDAGRMGGPVWRLVGMGPVFAERSLVLAGFAACGAAALTVLVGAAFESRRGAPALVLMCAWFATNSTQVINTQMFPRYFDTPTLLIYTWLGALILAGRGDAETRAAVGPPLLAILLALLFTATVLL